VRSVVIMGEAQPALRQAPVTTAVTTRRFRLASSATAAVLGVVLLAEVTGCGVLAGLAHQLSWSAVIGGPTGIVIFAGVGVLVAYRQPRNPVGWMLVLFSLLLTLGVVCEFYAALYYRLGYRGLPLVPAAIVLAPAAGTFGFIPLTLVVLLFPDGQLAWRRWRWVLWAYAGLSAYLVAAATAPAVAAVASHDVHVDSSGSIIDTGQLSGWLVHPPSWLNTGVNVAIGAIWVSFVGHQVLAWRYATGERRQQLKWLAFGAAIALGLGVGVGSAATGIVSSIASYTLIALPVSIGIGILKYRLYDIDRVISRTLAYAILTGLLVGVYAGLVLLATQVLTIKSPVAVAAATLAAAALFNPLRHRIQRVVDQRFNRARYDADQTIAAFAARLHDAVDLDSIQADLAGAVQKALEPAHVSVWVSRGT
jgi:hypothetical protein